MSKYSSPDAALLVDGNDLTPVVAESITGPAPESLTEQSNPLGSTAVGHTPTGMTQATVAVSNGWFDEAVDLLHAGLADSGLSDTVSATPRIMCVFREGHTIGNHFTGAEGAYSQKYEVLVTNGKDTKASPTYQITGQVDEGVIVQALAAQTVTWDTKATPVDAADDPTAEQIEITSSSLANPSVITTAGNHRLVTGDVIAIFEHLSVAPDINDSGAGAWQYVGHTVTVINATTFSIPVDVTDAGTGGYLVRVSWASGGYGYQQVTARTDITANLGEIVHSVDASTWVTLIAFTDTGSGAHVAERKATATTTTVVRRYLAHTGNLTTAGSTTVFSGFSRG